jgi:hypothetical protein
VPASASTVRSVQDIFVTTSRATSRLYLVRAVLALVWAGVLGAALSSAGTLPGGAIGGRSGLTKTSCRRRPADPTW